jgi:MFS transporter, PAT family, beta-lactamase induction signal transducer AmpG
MRASSARKIGLLSALYFAQGLPYGFQVTALPAYLRATGVSLTGIGFVGLLSTPWMAKALWAPLVDRTRGGALGLGRRKTWILPMQALLMISCALAALVPPDRGLALLLALVFLMNLFAATQDIAVDGLAVDMLEPQELGLGNTAQVVGYKLGMLTGGGLLVYLSGSIGWSGLFGAMALLIALVLAIALAAREPAQTTQAFAPPSLARVLALIKRALLADGAGWLVLFIASYKTGESMLDAMFKPFLVDAGYAPETIGLWVGTYGMAASLLGSVAGGVLASRTALLKAVGIAAALRLLPMVFEVWIALGHAAPPNVIAAVCLELFFGGALTTAMFAFMMSAVDRRIGATHYTLFASIEVLGKSASGWASGIIAQATSYAALFAIATLLSIAFLALLVPLRARAQRNDLSFASTK